MWESVDASANYWHLELSIFVDFRRCCNSSTAKQVLKRARQNHPVATPFENPYPKDSAIRCCVRVSELSFPLRLFASGVQESSAATSSSNSNSSRLTATAFSFSSRGRSGGKSSRCRKLFGNTIPFRFVSK